jgi:hypothetical protein
MLRCVGEGDVHGLQGGAEGVRGVPVRHVRLGDTGAAAAAVFEPPAKCFLDGLPPPSGSAA